MKRIIAIIVLIILIIICRKENLFSTDMPEFLIGKAVKVSEGQEASRIWEYELNGKKVYLVEYAANQNHLILYSDNSEILLINNPNIQNNKSYQDFLMYRKGGRMIWEKQHN